MRSLFLAASAVFISVLFVGCATPGARTQPSPTVGTPQDRPLPYRRQEQRLDVRRAQGSDMPAQRVIYVWDRTSAPDKTTADTSQKTAAILAQRGFTVMGDQANILVETKTSADVADSMGSSRVYKGTSDVTVFIRQGTDSKGARMLGMEQFETRGERAFSDSEARNSLTDALAQRISNWVAPLVVSDGLGIADTRFRAQEAFRELDEEIKRYGN